jgi:hypothetical protein
MTAANLLADLTGQGFRLVVCDKGIGVIPGSRLTKAQLRAIQKHKAELLTLLRDGAPWKAQGPVRKRKRRKASEQVAAPKASEVPNGEGEQPSSKPEQPLERIPEQKPPKPPLCPRCRQRGEPNCTTCSLAYDSSLKLGEDGVLYRVRHQTEEDRLPWRRCEICCSPFQAPHFSPNVCPDCRELKTCR